MPTPREGYYAADGKRVPGVTTVIGRFKDSGGLIHWAWNEGKEGRDYRDTSGKAADIGTLAHAFVEAKLMGKPEPDLFLYAAERMGVAPQTCVVVEDSVNGVRAARAAGMKVLAYGGGVTSSAKLEGTHTTVFEHMHHLPTLLSDVQLV